MEVVSYDLIQRNRFKGRTGMLINPYTLLNFNLDIFQQTSTSFMSFGPSATFGIDQDTNVKIGFVGGSSKQMVLGASHRIWEDW